MKYNIPITFQAVFLAGIDDRNKNQRVNAVPPVNFSYKPLSTVLLQKRIGILGSTAIV